MFKSLLFVLMATFVLIACKKNEEENLEPARLFKAGEISISAGQSSAKLKWPVPILSAGKPLTYTVDFSTDQAFSTIAFTKVVDTAGATVTDENLQPRTLYYARVKANAFQDQPESKYTISSTFQITGLQLMKEVNEDKIKETEATINYIPTIGLSSLVLKPANGNSITVPLTPTDAAGKEKVVTGLTPATSYSVEIFIGTRSVGFSSFTTLSVTNYTVMLNSGDNLAAQVSNAANGDVIGLNDGTYDLSVATTLISGKKITIKGISGNQANVKINVKQFDFEGNGAGITFSRVSLDGLLGNSQYFLNLIGAPATFADMVIEKSVVSNIAVSFIRTDRGNNGDYKMNNLTVHNSKIYAIGGISSAYHIFHLNELIFNNFSITKSTIYDSGPGLITANTLLAAPNIPIIKIAQSTLNGYGFGGTSRYALLDANTNPISFTLENSIVANTPKLAATIATAAVRSTGTGSSTIIRNNNFYKFTNASTGGTELTFPATATQSSVTKLDLPWTGNTTDFTLPEVSPLRTAGTSGRAIGDPRWTF
ncbi:Fibronectin type III domain protein [compost metagenome]